MNIELLTTLAVPLFIIIAFVVMDPDVRSWAASRRRSRRIRRIGDQLGRR